MKKIVKLILILVAVLVLFSTYKLGIYIGEENILKTAPSQISGQVSNEEKGNVDFSIFWEAWRQLERTFLDKSKIDYQKMVYGAIRGMVESLGDPYTDYFDPKETKEFSQELSGKYEGVGMEIGIKNSELTVIAPLKGGPAEKAGIRAGDKILKIDDIYTKDLSVDRAASLIRGKKGTKVTLLIERKSWLKPKSFELKRQVIKIPTLKWELIDENQRNNKNKIALIKIYQFNRLLEGDFKKISFNILKSGADRIILDLRNNPGGFLDVAENIAGYFLKNGDVVVMQDSGAGSKIEKYKSGGNAVFSNYPIVVLINNGSASAAEILAGALRDDRGVKLIGQTSFGKGSVQRRVMLSDGSSLKVTIAKWLTPNGYSIDKKGLEPDIDIEMTEDDWNNDRDPQLQKAIEVVDGL
ncbi:S41 family peptidase [bacterium]|nr:S41 family peptidase [bacterium]